MNINPARGVILISKPIRIYVCAVDRLSHLTGLVAMYLIFAMLAVLLLDTVTRNVFDVYIHWALEMGQFLLVAYYIAGGAYTLQSDQHVRMDLIYSHLSVKGKAWVDVVTSAFMIFYLVILLIGSVSSATYAIETGERKFSMWNPSMIPIKLIMVFGICLMLLQAFSLLFKDIARTRGTTIEGARGNEL